MVGTELTLHTSLPRIVPSPSLAHDACLLTEKVTMYAGNRLTDFIMSALPLIQMGETKRDLVLSLIYTLSFSNYILYNVLVRPF